MIKVLTMAMLTACTALPAHTQELACAPADAVMADIETQGYQLSFLGETDGNGTLLIVTGPKGWMAVVERIEGDMCILGMGVDWQLKQSGKPA